MKRFIIPIIFLLTMIVSACFISSVKVNYDLEHYLPEDSPIKEGIDVYHDEFGVTGSASIAFDESSISNAVIVKQELSQIDHVSKVVFIDDYFNAVTYQMMQAGLTVEQITQMDTFMTNMINMGKSYTEAMISLINYFPAEEKAELQAILSQYVSEDEVQMQIVFDTGVSDPLTETALDEIVDLLTDKGYEINMTGSAVSTIFTRNIIEKEIFWITIICIPLILALLLVMSRSYFDIILFGLVVGVSIVINLGTNVLLPDISFITKSMAIVLQIAISLDYVIFLIHAYHQERQKNLSVDDAIRNARKQTIKPILASALTTGASFLALLFMRFSIGLDIGIVFAKAIAISLLSTLLLLPVLIRIFSNWIDKTTKTRKSPIKGRLAERLYRFRYGFLALMVVVLAGSAFIQTKTEYTYGVESFAGSKGTDYYEQTKQIEDTFGRTNTMIIILPKNDLNEGTLVQQLSTLDYVSQIQAGIIYKSVIQDPLVLASVTSALYSENYALIQFNLDAPSEGEVAFGYYEEIQDMTDGLPGESYILGNVATAYNVRETVKADYNVVMMVALIAIMIIILITFGNLFMPILLPIVIETSVLFTMALLFLLNSEIVFLANIIVSAILLGVTIDYAILLSKSYMEIRADNDKKHSIRLAIEQTAPSIITSAALFSISGITISVISSIPTIAQIGLIIAVGAFTSLFYILIILPQLLSIFDKWIVKSNIRSNQ